MGSRNLNEATENKNKTHMKFMIKRDEKINKENQARILEDIEKKVNTKNTKKNEI